MPKMVRWEKVEGSDIPLFMKEALAVYKDKESVFYLSNFDHSNGTAIEQRWKVTNKEGEVLKGQYNCCGYRLKFPPIKWATKVVDNKREASNGEEEDDDDNRDSRDYDTGEVDGSDEEITTKSSMADIIAAVQEEGRPAEEPVKKRRGRKPGSKNKPKDTKSKKKGRGRPKGSKNKTKKGL